MPRQERERRYIAEYMAEKFPDLNYMLNVELGPIPEDLVQRHGYAMAAKLFRPTRLRVDAVAWTSDVYLLIEAKLRNLKDGIGDLLIYSRLGPKTLDLPYYDGQRFQMRLIVPFDLEWIRDITGATMIEYHIQWYDWIGDYVRERQEYFTAAHRFKRNEIIRLRKVLGVE